MTSAEIETDASVRSRLSVDSECPAPLPATAGGISRRKNARRRTSASLGSFTSETSVGSDPSKIVRVGDLRFLNDGDMPDGRSSVLGRGAFGMVRLARREAACRRPSTMSMSAMSDDFAQDDGGGGPPWTPGTASRGETNGDHGEVEGEHGGGDGVLVAVKIFEKSLLEKCRTIERDGNKQLQVRTALESVEREIAVMKIIKHPNLVSLHEVIDTGSNRLYMVLEYQPLGEIMTNVQGTANYRRRPARRGEAKVEGVTRGGYFNEHRAALFFVDIMHGLGHLHKNRIVHRDLKPENILLDSRGFAKIGDFGVAHLFPEDETGCSRRRPSPRASLSLSDLSPDPPMESLLPARISQLESEAYLKMKSMSDMGKLTKTEGTWCFWSPEMCAENSLVFSGYCCDIWAAGICLYVFATGKLPFYSNIPLVLFDQIADADIKLNGVKLTDNLADMLKKVLCKDPSSRAGIGECLKHPYCERARKQRMRELGEVVERNEEAIVREEDIQQAITSTRQRSLWDMAEIGSNISGRFLSLKNRLPMMAQTSKKSTSDNEPESQVAEGVKKSQRRARVTVPSSLAFWQSRQTISMDDEVDDGGSRRGNETSRKKPMLPFFRSTGQLR